MKHLDQVLGLLQKQIGNVDEVEEIQGTAADLRAEPELHSLVPCCKPGKVA